MCLGVRHKNSMQFITVEKLQKFGLSPETAEIVCNALTSAQRLTSLPIFGAL